MPITTREARQLTTVAEWPLVVSSLPAKIGDLSPARLKDKIERARKLRDKYVDLAKRQHRRTQSKRSGQPNEKLNARTKRKVVLFAEVLARFQSAVKTAKSAKGEAAKARKTRTPGSGKVVKGKAAKSAKRRAAKAQAAGARKAAKEEAAAEQAANAEVAQQGMASVAPPSKVKASRAPVVAKGDRVKRSGQVRMQAHVSSRGRRTQGRRDNR